MIAHNINNIKNGGGMHLSNSNVTFEGKCSVFNNSAHEYGGGIYVGNSTVLIKEEFSIFNNMAAKNGGGMNVENSNLSFQRELLLFNNSAYKDGGGVYIQHSNIMFKGECFGFNNSAHKDGGSMHLEHSTLNFLGNVTVSNCWAPHAGGGIASSYSDMKFWGSLNLIGNTASELNSAGGGGIIVWNGVINFTGDLFVAENHAGGLSLQNSSAYFEEGSDSLFIANTGHYGGVTCKHFNKIMFKIKMSVPEVYCNHFRKSIV